MGKTALEEIGSAREAARKKFSNPVKQRMLLLAAAQSLAAASPSSPMAQRMGGDGTDTLTFSATLRHHAAAASAPLLGSADFASPSTSRTVEGAAPPPADSVCSREKRAYSPRIQALWCSSGPAPALTIVRNTRSARERVAASAAAAAAAAALLAAAIRRFAT